MHAGRTWPILLALLSSCTAVRGADPTTADASLSFASQYWFRGVPRSTKPVLQGDVGLSMPLREGTFDFETWGNMQLSNDTGDAVFPDGNGGEFTQLDLDASHARRLGDFDVRAGIHSYNYPNLVANSTHELYVAASREAWKLQHTASLYYDFDVADDIYLNYEVLKRIALRDGWSLDLGASLGLMGSDQAELHFGDDDSGLSDLTVDAMVSRAFDAATTVFFGLSLTTVPDDGLRDALDDADVDDTGFWFTVGAGWSL